MANFHVYKKNPNRTLKIRIDVSKLRNKITSRAI